VLYELKSRHRLSQWRFFYAGGEVSEWELREWEEE